MKKVCLILLALLVAGFAVYQLRPEPAYQKMAMSELAGWMDTHQDYVLVDVRTQEEFAGGHIAGAICLPVESITKGELSLLPKKGKTTLVYCRSGARSQQAAESLLAQGYRDVIDCGGILDWPGTVEFGG